MTGEAKMDMTPYIKLAEAMNLRNMTLPSAPIPEFFTLVQELFTPEEAEIACAMPVGYSSIEQIAAKLPGTSIAELAPKLETMADKFVIEIRENNGKKSYELLPFIPGITELTGLGGFANEHDIKVHKLVMEYIWALEKLAATMPPPEPAPSSATRTVSVEEEVTHRSAVLPLSEVRTLLLNTKDIGAGICMCRRWGDLEKKPCAAPQDNCLVLGQSAIFAMGRNIVKRITSEEAIRRMEAADKAGLIHSYTNDPDHFINLLCNCCQCHCRIIQSIGNAPVPSEIITARYVVEIDEDSCTACETCIERCQMEALKMKDGKLTSNPIRCLGCGLCTSVCPTESLTLKPLETSKVPLGKC
jgi:Na+-translocating ferredoxin:NAD+ oxidoreductase subunit B